MLCSYVAARTIEAGRVSQRLGRVDTSICTYSHLKVAKHNLSDHSRKIVVDLCLLLLTRDSAIVNTVPGILCGYD